MMRLSSLRGLMTIGFAMVVGGEAGDFQQARRLYQETDYKGALRALGDRTSFDAQSFALAGRSSLMLGDLGTAGDYFQKAMTLEPANSSYVLWLGRYWARRAESSNPLSAAVAAGRAREYFEKAVALNPHNGDATGDLFDFYLEAPAMTGGGMDKAESLAARIEVFDHPEGHFDRARIAAKRKRNAEAEEQFRASLKLAPQAVGHVIAFARFLAQQGRIKESDAVLAQGEAASPGNTRLLYGKASIEIEMRRNLNDARQSLERYLTSNLTPDDPPREAAQKLLRKAAGM